MKIQLKTKIQQSKTFDYVLHILEITEANILDYIKIGELFISPDWSTCKWEEVLNEKDLCNGTSIRNIKENSFNVEIDDYDNNVLEYLKKFLINNELKYEI